MGKITKSREKLDSIRGEVISSTSRIDFILGYKLRTVRTYQGDVAGILKNQKTSFTKMVIAEEE
ncbi:MAG: hypothetical protein KJ821_05320, partial [Actinobacteria bacterium]|nr:hypothetical protein [Actinomycetota bacterium]